MKTENNIKYDIHNIIKINEKKESSLGTSNTNI